MKIKYLVIGLLAATCILLLWLYIGTSYTPKLADYCYKDHINQTLRTNLNSAEIKAALKSLRRIKNKDALFIGKNYLNFYGLSGNNSNNFLNVVCAEYADNPQRIKSMLRLLSQIHIAEESKQGYTKDEPLWTQLTGEGYRGLLFISKHLAYYRVKQKKETTRSISIAPPPFSFCELKYIFKEYLSKEREVNDEEDFKLYEKNLKIFLNSALKEGECSKEDLSTIVSFRGDGFLRPQSPEALSMRLYSRAIAENNTSTADALKRREEYIKEPFKTRYEYALRVFRSLFFYNKEHQEYLQWPRNPLFILTDSKNKNDTLDMLIVNSLHPEAEKKIINPIEDYSDVLLGRKIISKAEVAKLKTSLFEMLNAARFDGNNQQMLYLKNSLWNKKYSGLSDQGITRIFNLKSIVQASDVKERFATLFSRHADFYRTFIYSKHSGFLALGNSPFSSSSYYINQSHKFTFKGFAKDRITTNRMNWMYVYRIKKGNYYGIEELYTGHRPDIEKMWFNEKDFSDYDLAGEELALNKFALPDDSEFEALIWLGKVKVTPEVLDIAKTKVRQQAK